MIRSSSSAYSLPSYEPTGRCPLTGALLTLLLGVAAALVLAPVYSFVIFHNPSAWLGVMAPIGYAWLMVKVLTWCLRRFGICSPWKVALIALVSMTAGYWFHWYSYGAVVFAELADDPWNVTAILRETVDWMRSDYAGEDLWSFIQEVNEVGLWSFGRSQSSVEVNGPVLSMVWFGEFLILLGMPPFILWKAAKEPWSESLEQYMPSRQMDCVIAWQDAEKLRNQLSRGDVSALCEALTEDEGEEKPKEERYATVTLYEDPRTPCVSVTNVKKRKKKEKSTTVVQYVYITPEAAGQIQEALSLRSM